MAVATYGVNDTMAVKLWSKKLQVEALKATAIAPLIGSSADSVIQLKTELDKDAGDKITFGLRTQLQGDGVSENETLEGNEEALSTYADALVINELRHAVRVRNKNTIDQKRVPFNLRDESKSGLRDWYAKRMSVSAFNQVCGYTVANTPASQSSTTPGGGLKYTGLNAVLAPSAGRRLYTSTVNVTDESLGTGDKFKLIYLDYAKELAQTSTALSGPIRPVMVSGEETYVVYLHPYQVTDLRTDAATAGGWFDIQKAAIQGGQVSNNPIFKGALGMYNGMVLRQAFDVTQGVNSTTGATVPTTRRAVLMGAQAAVVGFANDSDETTFKWVEELFDYEHELGVSAQTMFGMKKTQFSGVDFGTIIISSYAAAHA